ncbi:MAG: STAS domain-containing protein [Phycisphaerae bacterium]
MDMQLDTEAAFPVVRLCGGIGLEDKTRFLERMHDLLAQRHPKVVIDLSEVDSIDSSGLSSLIEVVTRARLKEGRVILIGPNPFVRSVMEVTQLHRWFEICEDLEQASRLLA